MRKTSLAIFTVAALLLGLVTPARSQFTYDAFHNVLTSPARVHQDFSLTGTQTSTPLPLQSASECVVTVRTAPTSGTLTVRGASDNVGTYGTITTFGNASPTNGVITNPGTSSQWPGQTVSPNAVAMASVIVVANVVGTAVGSIDCAPLGGGGGGSSIANPLPVSGQCLPGTASSSPVGNCFTWQNHVPPVSGAEAPESFGAATQFNLGSGTSTGCTVIATSARRLVSLTNVTGAALAGVTVQIYDETGIASCTAADLRWTFHADVYLFQPLSIALAHGAATVITGTLPDATDIVLGVNNY